MLCLDAFDVADMRFRLNLSHAFMSWYSVVVEMMSDFLCR